MEKIIHYIWLGQQPKTKLIKKCINSWKKHMPDWEIKEWNESNLDLDINRYCRQAYDSKKYAFASDVHRFEILSRYGGLYMDVDVEILRNFDDLIEKNDAFCGFEYNKKIVNPGLVLYAKKPHNPIIDKMCTVYNSISFDKDIIMPKTVCEYMMEILEKEGLKQENEIQLLDDITIFPATYFCPTNNTWSVQNFSEKTRTIHHYNASWLNGSGVKNSIKKKFFKIIGNHGIVVLKRLRTRVKGN